MAKLSSSNSKKVNVPKLRFPDFTEEWEESNIGEISTYIKGAPLSKANISETGTPFILYGELYTTYKEVATEIKRKTNCIVDNKYFSKIGDVVIPTSGETPEEIATATCVMTPNVILAGDLNIFRINDIDGRFFSYVINHKANKDISRIAQGKSIVHIKGEEISKIPIKYPSDEEQQKILSFIELLSLKIEKQEQIIENLKKYKRGALSALFPKKGEITPPYRFAGFTEPWEQRKLGDIADIVGGGTPSTRNPEYWDGDIDWYAPAEIANQIYVKSSRRKITEQGYDNSSAKLLPPGTVLFTSRAGIGKTAILARKGCTNQGFQSIIPHKDELDSYFIFSQTEELKRYGELVGAGSTFVEVSGKQMAAMDLMIPSTIREQQTIGAFFKNLDNLITLYQHKFDTLLSLKNALLQQMFI